ncbi:hypothetical protein, partial [Kozakia baliensis]|uniref:hypothetical protein n=1 Tax=Kozakia baliensis TaxID=153496 RepID=UPI00055F4DFF
GDDPEILPAVFSARAGGQVTFRADDAVKASVRLTAADLMADALGALDAVAREEDSSGQADGMG